MAGMTHRRKVYPSNGFYPAEWKDLSLFKMPVLKSIGSVERCSDQPLDSNDNGEVLLLERSGTVLARLKSSFTIS